MSSDPQLAPFLEYPCIFCESPLTDEDVIAAFKNIKRLNAKILEENREVQEEDPDFVPSKLIPSPKPRTVPCQRSECVKAQQAQIKNSLANPAAPDEDTPSDIEPTEEELAAITAAEGKKTTKKEREKLAEVMRRDKAEDPDESELFSGKRNETVAHQPLSTYELDELPKLARIRLQAGQATDSRGVPQSLSVGSFVPSVPDEWMCIRHRQINCPTCRSVIDSQALVIARGRVIGKHLNPAEAIPQVKPVPLPSPAVDQLKEIKREVKQRLLENAPKTYAARAKAPQRERKRRVEPKKIHNLRKVHGYETRDLASLFDKVSFNDRVPRTNYDLLSSDERIPGRNLKWRNVHAEIMSGTRKQPPRTMPELENMLPMISVPRFADAQITFYRRYAARNDAEDQLKQIVVQNKLVGFADFILGTSSFGDCIIRLENEIIEHAWRLRLLVPNEGVSEAQVDAKDALEQARDQEGKYQSQSIDKSGAPGAQVLAGKRRTTGDTYGRYELSSFDGKRKYRPHSGSDLGSESEPNTPEHDDYGDESGA